MPAFVYNVAHVIYETVQKLLDESRVCRTREQQVCIGGERANELSYAKHCNSVEINTLYYSTRRSCD